MQKSVHVAVAVIQRSSAGKEPEILLSKRAEHVHQGGLWEFPGGKVELLETVQEALNRELEEELGIQIVRLDNDEFAATPLISIEHDYGDKQVLLDVWLVEQIVGEPHGKEGQPVEWVPKGDLHRYDFPAANKPIVAACLLPREVAFTQDHSDVVRAKSAFSALLGQRPPLVILRTPQLMSSASKDYVNFISQAKNEATNVGSLVLLHNDIDNLEPLDFDGVHLSASVAASFVSRPIASDKLLGVSCHNEAEIQHALGLGADYITLSPVNKTASHPDAPAKGWSWFREQVKACNIPVYALGGLARSDLNLATKQGAQGVAGISCWL